MWSSLSCRSPAISVPGRTPNLCRWTSPLKTEASLSDYEISIEPFKAAWPELEPLCSVHYGEMQARMASEGMKIGPFKPRLNVYGEADHLLCFVVRSEGE